MGSCSQCILVGFCSLWMLVGKTVAIDINARYSANPNVIRFSRGRTNAASRARPMITKHRSRIRPAHWIPVRYADFM